MKERKTYEEFMAMLDESLESYISSERPECTLEKSEVLNPNEKREAFTVVDASYYEGRQAFPVFYYDQLYERYVKGQSVGEIFDLVRSAIENASKNQKNLTDFYYSFEKMQRNVFQSVINTERNRAFLEEVVHRDLPELGLSIIYRICDPGKSLYGLIYKYQLDLYNMTEEELYQRSRVNMLTSIPVEITEFSPGLIVSNGQSIFGAGYILIDTVQNRISQEMGGDYYICPSSIHETICCSSDIDKAGLQNTVKHVNAEFLEKRDFLSDDLFYYDHRQKKVIRVM